ncbi:MAG: hypothetical protein U1E53_31190 [Dongiaceae bacterium]
MTPITRRGFLRRSALAALCALAARPGGAGAAGPATLLSAPIEITGDWNGSLPASVAAVAARTRQACLGGVRLLSDRQPARLRIEGRASGPPAIWLHPGEPDTAWVVLDVGARDWSRLAYQLGHELGHVLCNSWQPDAAPRPPSQWLEEAMVEAFSLRGLGRLAAIWQVEPPFLGDETFALPVLDYRGKANRRYRRAAPAATPGAWFRERRAPLEALSGLAPEAGPAVLAVLREIESDPACVEDLGALNRWPERSALPLDRYLPAWRSSCAAIGASGRLPERLAALLLGG